MSRGRALRLLPLGFMAAIAFITYGAIAWTLRRGLDWTDETFVLNMVASNRRAVAEPWGFQHLLYPLYVLTGQSVLAFRVLRLAGYVLLSVALVWTARFIVRRMGINIPRSGWAFVLILAQVGTFFAWSYPPRYLSYNELSSWFTQIGVALILLSLAWAAFPIRAQEASSPGGQRGPSPGGTQGSWPPADDEPGRPPRARGASWVLWPIWAGLGAITTLLVFAKITSAVAFAAILALALVVPNPYLRLWKRLVAAGAGATLVLLVLWVLRSPVGFYLTNMYDLLTNKSKRDAFGHPTSQVIRAYQDSLLSTGRALFPALLIFALLAATFLRRVRARAWVTWLSWVLGVLLVMALVALPRDNVWLYLGDLVVFIGGAGVIGLAILGAHGVVKSRAAMSQTAMPSAVKDRSTRSRAFSVALGGVAIVAAPFLMSVGTDNPIAGEFVFAATLWAVVLGVVLVLLAQQSAVMHSTARIVPTLVGCTVILLGATAVKADIAKPYRTPPLLTQQTSTSVPELRGLLLSEGDAAWIDWVAAAGRSLDAQGVPATAVYASGALYAFNHSGYANPDIGSKWQAAYKSLTFACRTNPPSDLFVLQPGIGANRGSAAGVARSLAACGIKFPADFRVVDRRVSADPAHTMTIWRLRSG